MEVRRFKKLRNKRYELQNATKRLTGAAGCNEQESKRLQTTDVRLQTMDRNFTRIHHNKHEEQKTINNTGVSEGYKQETGVSKRYKQWM